MFKPFTWNGYSNKLKARIIKPLAVGRLTSKPAEMRLVSGKAGQLRSGNLIEITLIVDEADGVIADSRFLAYGNTALIGAGDVVCELVLRKNYDQAMRISAELIDSQVRDRKNRPAFPEDVGSHINLALSALEEALGQCDDIPLPTSYTPPTPFQADGESTCIENWLDLSVEEKKQVIEGVIASDIRPYIELDAGGIEIAKLEGYKLTIAYQGACTTCYSAVGSTLSAIQGILRQKVHPQIEVEPDASALSLS